MNAHSAIIITSLISLVLSGCVATGPSEKLSLNKLPFVVPAEKPVMSAERRLPQLGGATSKCNEFPRLISQLNQMADQGDSLAALCLANSRKVTGYEALGNYWLAKLALDENPEAESRVAHIFHFEKRDPVAAYWYMKSAYKHNITAQFMLGLIAGAAWEKSERDEFRELNRKWLAASKVYKGLKAKRSDHELQVIATELMPKDTMETRSLMREAFLLAYR